MKLIVDQSPANNGDDFVDRVGELITPVLDMDSGLAMPDEPTVYV
jgi:hypothetical protein